MRRKSPLSPEHEAMIEEIIEKARHELAAELPSDTATLDEIETAAGRIGQKVSSELRKRLLEQQEKRGSSDTSPSAETNEVLSRTPVP